MTPPAPDIHPIQNTWAEGLNPRYATLTDIQSKFFTAAALLSIRNEAPPDAMQLDEEFLIKILDERINSFKLPISFAPQAKMAVLAFADRPGAIVMLLIDCLNAFEGKTVTVNDLVNLYPLGFYDEETAMRYVDRYLKPKKVKWAEIY